MNRNVLSRWTGWTLLLFLMALATAPTGAFAVGTPHLVYGDLTMSENTVPADEAVTLEATIDSRPDETLTHLDAGTGYQNGAWWVEVGNFTTPWAAGETLRVVATNEETGESLTDSIVLTTDGQQEMDLVAPPGSGDGDGDDGDGDDGGDDGDAVDDDGGSGDTNNCFIASVAGKPGFGPAAGIVLLLAGLAAVLGRGKKTFGILRNYLLMSAIILPLFLPGPADSQTTTATFSLQPGLNAVSLPLGNSGISAAADILDIVEGAQVVAIWDAPEQGYIQPTDVTPGMPLFIQAGEAFTWNIEGDDLPARTVDLITTGSTNINVVAIPLDRTDIENAEQLVSEIPNADTVWYWDTERGGYVGHPMGTEINNFSVEPGYAYFVNVTGEGTWNQTGEGEADGVHTVAPGEPLQFSLPIPQTDVPDLTLPLTYEITRAMKGDTAIELPANLDFDIDTGRFSWTPAEDQVGAYTFGMKITDSDAYSRTEDIFVTVESDDQLITAASAAPGFITPADTEESVITYSLAEAATVTIDLYSTELVFDAGGEGRFQQEFLMTLLDAETRPEGESTLAWDGRGPDGEIAVPAAYRFIIQAETDDGKSSIRGFGYTDGAATVSDLAILDPDTGEPVESFDPSAGETVQIQYNLSHPAWVTIGGENIPGSIIEGAPRDAGMNTELWDGTTTQGETVPDGTSLQLNATARRLPENVIVVQAPSADGEVVALLTATMR